MSIKPEMYIYIDPKIEENMPESDDHSVLIEKLRPLLKWLYREQNWFITGNLLIIQNTASTTRKTSPDIAIFKGVQQPVSDTTITSWRIGEPNRPAPAVVFEVASEATWQNDVGDKVGEYGLLGVQEYFTYDPNMPPLWGVKNQRLRGWSYNPVGQAIILETDERGWLWSEQLQAWLEPDSKTLHLCNQAGQRLLTEAETKQAALQAEQITRRAIRTKLKAEQTARKAAQVAEYQTRLAAEQRIQELETRLRELEGDKSSGS
jgi:Uma2 family endonuclease